MTQLQLPQKFRLLDGSFLKTIAVLTMLIDHTAAGIIWLSVIKPAVPLEKGSGLYRLYLIYRLMRGIGRIAFPIFCFMLTEGFRYTRSRKSYALRLLLFALLSEIPFDLGLYHRVFYPGHQNVIFTLLLGFLLMWGWDISGQKIRSALLSDLVRFLVLIGICLAAFLLKTDYDFRGILLISVLYLLRYSPLAQLTAGALVMYWEWPAVLIAFPLLALYSGKKGKGSKYFFYLFYPLHLLLLFAASVLLHYGP